MNRKEKRNKSKELNILNDVITIINQYFPELIEKFEGLTDLRHQSYVTYKMKVIFIVRLLALMCEIKTMHGLTRELNTEEAIKNIAQICRLELNELPHCDTINDVFSIGSEFVENEEENVDKQDCEINAFKRLANKIKKEYPRLRIIISGDALYASKPVMEICKENKWKYIIRFKEGSIPTLYKEYETIVATDNESKIENYEFVTKLDYQGNKTNIIKYKDEKKRNRVCICDRLKYNK